MNSFIIRIIIFCFLVFSQYAQAAIAEEINFLVLNHGVLALKERIKLIESAEHRIDFETFFIYPGYGTDLILDALIKKAKEGIQVNILVDHFVMVQKQKDHRLALLAASKNLNVKFFNTNKLNRNRRDHRKILCIDSGEKGCLIGGRNIGDEYWAMGSKFHHLDREVILYEPEINKQIFESFLQFWNYKYSEDSSHFLQHGKKKSFVTSENNQELQDLYLDIMNFDEQSVPVEFQNIKTSCKSLKFITDLPHTNTHTSPGLENFIRDTRENLLIESPTLILRFTRQRMPILELLQQGISVSALFLGGDADNLAVAMFNIDSAKWFMSCGLKAYAKNKNYLSHDYHQFIDQKYENIPFLMHSKVYLRDTKDIWIGSYNLDPRSNNINAELGLICSDNPELASKLAMSMKAWQQLGTLLDLKASNYSEEKYHQAIKKYFIKQSLRPLKRML